MSSRTTVVAALGTAQTLAWASSYYLPAILVAPIARDLGRPASWVFAAFSGALVVTAALGPVVGQTIDRRGGRGVLCASNITLALGLALLAAAHGPVGLAAAWMVLGAGMAAGLYDAAYATLTGLYGREARGAITGITLIAGFASTIGWPLSTVLDAALGWRGACLAWAALHLVLGLPLNRFLIPLAPHAAALPHAAAMPQPVSEPAPPRAMALLAYVFAAVAMVSTGMASHLPRLLQAVGATSEAAVAAAALIGPAQVAARLFEWFVLRRLHPVTSACLATALHPVGAIFLAVFGPPAAAVFAVLHGAGNGMLSLAKGTLPLAVFGPEGYGLRTGQLAALGRCAQAGAPLVFGMALSRGGIGALALSGGLSLTALIALLMLGPAPATAQPLEKRELRLSPSWIRPPPDAPRHGEESKPGE
jgi:predicted MFS family arabinose efflux permease